MVSKKQRFSSDLTKLLGLDPMKLYSFKEIESMITTAHIKTATKLFSDLKSSCGCGQCGLNKKDFVDYIKENLVIKDVKPSCNYYEFNQKPVQITSIVDFE